MNKNYLIQTIFLPCLLSISLVCKADIPMLEYFPLPEGGGWNYLSSEDGEIITAKILGTDIVNGTTVIQLDNGPQGILSFTNDANGLRLHQIETDLFSGRVTFSPPIPLANAQASIGDNLRSSGTSEMTVPRAGSFSLAYTSTSKIATQEFVNVPFGNLNTIRLEFTFGLSGTINGISINDSVTSTLSLSPGVGVVLDNEGGVLLRLTDTDACNASYSVNTQLLRLPIIVAGPTAYSATLKLTPLLQGKIGFVLETAVLTACTSGPTATFNAAAGTLIIPRLDIYNNSFKSGQPIRAEMKLVEGSNPITFSLIVTQDAN